jgi:hypothetical protein
MVILIPRTSNFVKIQTKQYRNLAKHVVCANQGSDIGCRAQSESDQVKCLISFMKHLDIPAAGHAAPKTGIIFGTKSL